MPVDVTSRIAGSGTPGIAQGAQTRLSTFLLCTLFALLILRLLFMAWLPLTDTTEARYAEIARKMLETGDWITPQFDYGVPFWGKPPLHTWLAAGGMAVFGVGAFAARLPILLVSVGVIWALFVFAKHVSTRAAALLAITVCATSVLFFGAAAFVMTDMVKVLGTTVSMAAFFLVLKGRTKSDGWKYLFFVGLAIGLLAKGPIAVVLTGIPCGLWVVFRGRLADLRRLPWAKGVGLTIVIAGPWYLAAEISTPGFLRYFLIGEHIERFIVPGWQGDLYGSGHREAKGMIWLFGLGVFLPWTPLTLFLLCKQRRLRTDPDLAYYLLFWTLAPMVVFTPAANILPAYVLPAVPAFAFLTALLVSDACEEGEWPKAATIAACTASLCFFVAVIFAARYAPASVGLRTTQGLVEVAHAQDSRIAISVYPARSYSAEFYTEGRARTLSDLEAIRSLAGNTVRDAVIVPNNFAKQALGSLGPTFAIVSSDHKNHVFIEVGP